jgi:hypothetical protein
MFPADFDGLGSFSECRLPVDLMSKAAYPHLEALIRRQLKAEYGIEAHYSATKRRIAKQLFRGGIVRGNGSPWSNQESVFDSITASYSSLLRLLLL